MSLIENVRRGNRTKREKAWFPGYAPVGYLNARNEMGDKIIVPDPERFISIQENLADVPYRSLFCPATHENQRTWT